MISPEAPLRWSAQRTGQNVFAVITSLIDLVAEIIGGTFRLVATFVSSCFGLALVAILVTGLVIFGLLHLL
jgi:hypothetical protein